MFKILRNTFKYDLIFIRDPKQKNYIVDPANVTRIIVNESKVKLLNNMLLKILI